MGSSACTFLTVILGKGWLLRVESRTLSVRAPQELIGQKRNSGMLA